MDTLFLFLTLTVGGFCLLSSSIQMVPTGTLKALSARSEEKLQGADLFIMQLAERLAPHLDLDPMKRERLRDDLQAVGKDASPECFMAKSYVEAGVVFCLVLLGGSLLSVPLAAMGGVLAAYMVYTKSRKELSRKMKERREKIALELPQLAGTIRQHLRTSKNVEEMLRSYLKIAGPVLAMEMTRTLNDIATGNMEKALIHFATRINSSQVNELTRGLIGVTKGDDQQIYFEMLAADFTRNQQEIMKREMLTRPAKLSPYMFGLLGAVVSIFLCALISYAMASTKNIF